MRHITLEEDKEVGYFLRITYGEDSGEFCIEDDLGGMSFDKTIAKKVADFIIEVLNESKRGKK